MTSHESYEHTRVCTFTTTHTCTHTHLSCHCSPAPGWPPGPSTPGARGLHLSPRPAPALPACWCRRQSLLYIMLTVEITSELLFYTSPCQNSLQPSDQDKLNTIPAVSIFIPFYKCSRMGGRALLWCQPSRAPGGPSSSHA